MNGGLNPELPTLELKKRKELGKRDAQQSDYNRMGARKLRG